MKRFLPLLVCAIALTGCAVTPVEMRNSKPYASFTSKKDPDALSKCVANGIEGRSYWGVSPRVIFRPIDNGVSISTEGNIELIDFVKNSKSTRVEFYSAFTHTWIGPNQGRLDDDVRDINKCL